MSENIKTAINKNIQDAKKSIFIATLTLSNEEIINNLIAAGKRGVAVRVILDPNTQNFWNNKETAQKLTKNGISVRWYQVDLDKRDELNYKAIIFDDKTSIIGQCDLSKAGNKTDHGADIEILSNDVGIEFTCQFEVQWKKATEKPQFVPDFKETVPSTPLKEQIASELFRHFAANFQPNEKIFLNNENKQKIKSAVEKAETSPKKSSFDFLANAGTGIDEKQFEAIGQLANFFGDIKEFEMKPSPGDKSPVYDRRVEISATAAREIHKNVPDYLKDMANSIKDKELRAFLEMAFSKVSKGFLMAPSAATGKWHPADELDAGDVNVSPKAPKIDYKGGGLVLHSRRTHMMADKLCGYFELKGKERDEILVAMALHDILKEVTMEDIKKSGIDVANIPWQGKTSPDHGHVAAEWIKGLDSSPNKVMTENIAKYVSMHMAVWNAPKPTPPQNINELIISLADYIPSIRTMYLEV